MDKQRKGYYLNFFFEKVTACTFGWCFVHLLCFFEAKAAVQETNRRLTKASRLCASSYLFLPFLAFSSKRYQKEPVRSKKANKPKMCQSKIDNTKKKRKLENKNKTLGFGVMFKKRLFFCLSLAEKEECI